MSTLKISKVIHIGLLEDGDHISLENWCHQKHKQKMGISNIQMYYYYMYAIV